MKTPFLPALLFSFGASAFCLAAPDASSYQVTGPVVAVDETKIVVQKGKDTWEIKRKADIKITGGTADQIKPGSKVTIHYTMEADAVEIKPEKAGKEAAPAPSPKTSGTGAQKK